MDRIYGLIVHRPKLILLIIVLLTAFFALRARHIQLDSSIESLLPQDDTVAFYRRRFDNGWNFYLDKPIIPVITNEQIKQAQPDYDLIILRKKHLKLLKAALDMNRYRIAASEPVGSKQFVLLKYDGH